MEGLISFNLKDQRSKLIIVDYITDIVFRKFNIYLLLELEFKLLKE